MSGVAASVKLNDQMTPTIKRIEKHLDNLISKLTKLESTVTKAMTKTAQVSNKTAQAINKTALQEERLKLAVEKTNAARLKTQTQAQKLAQQEMRTKQMVDKANASQQRFNNSMRRGVGIANGLGNAIKAGIGAYLGVQGVSKAIGLADNLQMTTNRLDLLGKGKMSTDELKQKIYESAMRSRADYLGTADSVAKMGLRTGDTFKSMDELIAFNETLNKMYAIAGTGAHEQFGATLQLIQALGSGVLRGQEFNAVFEAAPNVLQAVADHMKVPVEKLREMAEDGAITADIIKNAMFEAAETTNEKFKALKYTFGHVFTGLKNSALHSFEPVLKQISDITSSKRWIKFIDGIGVAIDNLAKWSSKALDVITAIASTIFDNWSLIAPIIWGIVGALVVYNATLTVGLIKSAIHWMVATYNAIAYQWALFKMAVAQYGFNTALAMCPLSWFLYALVAIVAVFYLIIAAVNKFTGVSVSATGLIAGAFSWLGAGIINVFIFVYNRVIGVINKIVNGCIKAAEIIYNALNGGFTSWMGGFASAFGDLISWVLGKIKPLVQLWDNFKGTNYAGTISDWQGKVSSWGKTSSYKKFDGYDSFKKEHSANYINMNKAWEKGYDFGANLVGDLSLDNLGKTISGVTNGVSSDAGKYLTGGFADNPALDDILKNTKDIANNTSVIANDEDLSYMRDMATRQAIDRHTTRNVTINMTNNNNISKDADADGILNKIRRVLYEEANVNASGVHY